MASKDSRSVHPQSTRGKLGDGFGVGKTFLLEDADRQGGGGVVIQHRNRLLQNDRPVVVLIINEMNRTTADFAAPGDDRRVDFFAVVTFAGEGRNQRRMNVHHPQREIRGNLQQGQEATTDDEIHTRQAAFVKDRGAEFEDGWEGLSFDDPGGQTGRVSFCYTAAIGAAGDDQGHFRP